MKIGVSPKMLTGRVRTVCKMFAMDPAGLAIGAVILFCLAGGGLAVGGWWYWQIKRQKTAKSWPMAEATIQEAAIETVYSSRYGSVRLPSFAFSFAVDGQYFSGRISIVPDNESRESLVKRLENASFTVQYDPTNPNRFYVPEGQWPGCEVKQPLSPHFMRLYAVD